MPVENRYKLALNIKDKVNKYVPTVTAFDKTIFEFEVWDGGKLFELSDTYMYHLVTKSPGKNSVIREGSLTVSGLVEAEFSYSETQYLRPVDCALQIYDEDMNRITSMRFRVEIMDDLSRAGGLPAESPRVIIADEELLTQAITDSSAAKTEVEQARGEEESLSARFDSVAAELERKASVNDISNLTVELSGKAEATELYDIASQKADESDLQTVAAQLAETVLIVRGDTITEVQSFFNNVPNGSKIQFPKKSYQFDDVLVISNKLDLVIDYSQASFKTIKHGYGLVEYIGCYNIVHVGGDFEGAGNFYPNTFENGALKNEKMTSTVGWGMHRNGSAVTTLYNNGYLHNCGIGILVHEGCSNVVIEKAISHGFNYVGIGVGFSGDGNDANNPINYCSNVTIKGCECYGNFDAGISVQGVKGFWVKDNHLHDNGHPNATITDTVADPGYGITLRSGMYCAENGLVSENICVDNKRKGIDAHAGRDFKIVNNRVKGSYYSGIMVTDYLNQPLGDYTIEGNDVEDCGNTFHDYNEGIHADGNGIGIVRNNLIKNCGYKKGHPSSHLRTNTGLYVERGSKIVSGNTLINSGLKNGIFAAVNIDSLYIENNKVISDESEMLIRIRPDDNNFVRYASIQSNTLENKNGHGVLLQNITKGVYDNNELILGDVSKESVMYRNSNVVHGIGNKGAVMKLTEQNTNPTIFSSKSYPIDISITDGVITYVDYSGELVERVESDPNGLNIITKKQVRGHAQVIVGTSTGNNLFKNIYLRTFDPLLVRIGLGNTVDSLGVPASGIASLKLHVTIYSTI